MKSSNSRIAKNAIALYFRMFVTMLVGLYTSRVILNALGVTDFGIFGVVGGFVAMFTILTSSMSASISRFITFELGKENNERLRLIFSTSIISLIGIAIVLIVITETVGLWYLYNVMVIPADRMTAAFWCFQFSLISLVLTLINMPYNAAIIAHERMDIYAYLSIFIALLKLGICFIVLYADTDKLILYGALICLLSIINQVVYLLFCKSKFPECRFKYVFNKPLLKEISSFAGWNFIGSSASILTSQGSNLLLNWAGGPVVNASYTIANNASGLISTFVNNFTQAFNPQITKRYAKAEYSSLMNLLIYGSKYSYYLMFIIALPIMLNTDFLIRLWLGTVPEYTVPFVRFIILANLFDAISRPIVTAKCATGKIRNYQIVVGGFLLIVLPISYILLKIGVSVVCVTSVAAVVSLGAVFVRMYMMRGDFPYWSSSVFSRKVIFNVLVVSIISSIAPVLSYKFLSHGWCNFIVTSFVSVLSCLICIYTIGCDKGERTLINEKAKDIFKKK